MNNIEPWFRYEEEPYPGTTVDPQDVCSPSAASTPPSTHCTVDWEKPTHEYMGFSPASMSLVSGDLNANTTHSKPEADRARPSSCNPTTIPTSTRGVKRSRRKQNVDSRENLDNSPSSLRRATSSSSSVVVKGFNRSRDNSLKILWTNSVIIKS